MRGTPPRETLPNRANKRVNSCTEGTYLHNSVKTAATIKDKFKTLSRNPNCL